MEIVPKAGAFSIQSLEYQVPPLVRLIVMPKVLGSVSSEMHAKAGATQALKCLFRVT